MIRIHESGPQMGLIDHKALTIADLQTIYLDWTNNFLTLEKFAEHYGMTEAQARATIESGSMVHEQYVSWLWHIDRGAPC